jgi:serine/threonine/tyrosine-interacting protein
MEDWKYESRRQIQRVLPFLYLGPFIALKNYEFLRNEGITLLLVIRDTMIATARILSGNKAAKELGIEALAVDVSGNQQLIAAFPRAIKTINDHLISKYESKPVDGEPLGPNSRMITRGKVLVFCESGNERSATVIAAYIMAMYNVDMVTAVQYLQSARFCVAIDDALKHLLLTHQEILEAQKATQTPDNQFSSRIILKRGRDDMDEDVEMNEDHGDGNERFSGRHGFQPFHDG